MLAFIFRAFCLIGVISWYSTSVWKMIDVYFKNRFESYLRAEYDKNPHMLADVEAYRATAGKENPPSPIPEEEEIQLRRVVEACSADVCLASINEDDSKISEVITANKEASFSSEYPIEVVQHETAGTTEPRPASSTGENEITKVDEITESASVILKNDSANSGNVKRKKTRRSIARGEVQDGKTEENQEQKQEIKKKKTKKKKKNKLKTITLTEKDFASTRIKVTPQDFAEFDVEEDVVQAPEDEPAGILVSELPFKPKLDLGDLRRVSPEEFCPITLDDELSCDETTTWP